MQETLSNKLKLIVTNMEHEVDDLRSNQQMDRMDIKNDIGSILTQDFFFIQNDKIFSKFLYSKTFGRF